MLLWAAIVGLGLLIKGPLDGIPSAETISKDVAQTRTPTWNTITMVWSHIGNTEIVIGVYVVAVALLWWGTHEWWGGTCAAGPGSSVCRGPESQGWRAGAACAEAHRPGLMNWSASNPPKSPDRA